MLRVRRPRILLNLSSETPRSENGHDYSVSDEKPSDEGSGKLSARGAERVDEEDDSDDEAENAPDELSHDVLLR